jgi:DNA-binding response OmpR family regulator
VKHELIGQLLVQRGAVSAEVVEKAVRLAAKEGGRLCSKLLEIGACDESDLVAVLADKHGVPGVDLSRTIISVDVLDLVPHAVARSDRVFPLSVEGGRLHLAVASPSEGGKTLAEVRFVTGREISSYIAVSAALERSIEEAYTAAARGDATWRGRSAPDSDPPRVAVSLPGGEPLELGDDDIEGLEASAEMLGSGTEIRIDPEDDEPLDSRKGSTGRKRVLVVDDEPEIRMLARHTLEVSGYEVDVASDGAEAIEKIGSFHPDLVLLDAMLPKLHGFEVCRRVKSDPATRNLPVIIMTAIYRGWRFAHDARETYGAEDYVEKPFHIADLLRRIDALLNSSVRARANASSAEPHIRRGRELVSRGMLEDGLAAFEKAVEADPFSAEGHHLLAKALRARGDHFRAMSEFERAVELRPDMFSALRSLAALYVETGFRRKAAEVTERALRVAPDEESRKTIREELIKLL